jgi:hypothetical protein
MIGKRKGKAVCVNSAVREDGSGEEGVVVVV